MQTQDQKIINLQATARDMKKLMGLWEHRPAPPAEPTPWRYETTNPNSEFTVERINAISAQVLLDGVHLETIRSAKDCPIRLGKLFAKVYATAHGIEDYSTRVEL